MTLFENVPLFLIGISTLFPLVNPVGTAIIINPYFSGLSLVQRKSNAARVVFYSFGLGLGTLVVGSWVLKVMGIEISTTQMAGGLVIARMGLAMLSSDSDQNSSASVKQNLSKSLFYPIAFPLTVGPGVISALITLSAHAHGSDLTQTWLRIGVLSISLLAVCVLTYFCFAYSQVVIQRIGNSGSLIVSRLSAFIVFCIGVQMAVTGLKNMFPHLFS